jgi:hypothetical protein
MSWVFATVRAAQKALGLDVYSLDEILSVAGARPWESLRLVLEAADERWTFTVDCRGVGVYLHGMAAFAGGRRVIAALADLPPLRRAVAAEPMVG